MARQGSPSAGRGRPEAKAAWLRLGLGLAAVAVLVAAGLAIGLFLIGSETVQYVHEMPRFQTAVAAIRCDPGPSWIQKDFLEEVRALAGLPPRFSVLDAAALQRLHKGLKLHPWVRDVVWIRTEYPNRVHVKVHYRYPVALVRVDNGWKIVDGDGVVLPANIPPAERHRCFQLTADIRTAPPEAGARWDDEAVQAGAQLAVLLAPHREHLGLTTIDLSNLNGRLDPRRPEVVLLTAFGTRIAWGRPPNTDKPGEIPPGEKIERLLLYREKFPSDYPHCDLDVRHWDGITHHRRTG